VRERERFVEGNYDYDDVREREIDCGKFEMNERDREIL
jgi:hypothetical protein